MVFSGRGRSRSGVGGGIIAEAGVRSGGRRTKIQRIARDTVKSPCAWTAGWPLIPAEPATITPRSRQRGHTPMRVLVYEQLHAGHYYYYLHYLLPALLE